MELIATYTINNLMIVLLKGSSFYNKVVIPEDMLFPALLATCELLARPLPYMVKVCFFKPLPRWAKVFFFVHKGVRLSLVFYEEWR